MRWLVKYVVALVAAALNIASFALTQHAQSWTLDDFEDGNLEGASRVSWIVIADDLAGGDTVARLDLQTGSPESRYALRLSGTLAAGNSSFAGAWLPLERTGRSLDLSGFEGVRLRVKSPAPLDVGFRAGLTNFLARIDASPEWKTVEIPFTSLKPSDTTRDSAWDASAVHVFGVKTPPGATGAVGRFSFSIDDVTFYGNRTPREPIASGPATGLTVVPFTGAGNLPTAGWVDLGPDPERDGKMPALPDATRLEAIPSGADGMLWVRVSLREPPHGRWMGMNLALDVDGDPANGSAWWGANNAFKFDRIVTAWCFRVASGCQGFIGIADAAQAASGTFVAGGGDAIRVAIDAERRAFVVGVRRSLLGLGGQPVRLVAAVGSALLYADDVPGQGAATIR